MPLPFGAFHEGQVFNDVGVTVQISFSISALAMSEYGRVQNNEIRRDPNCMMHAARDQMVTVDPTRLSHLTHNTVRADCIEYVIAKHGETLYDTLLSSDEYSGWSNWAEQMGDEHHYGDKLLFEAICNLYGGFNIITIVGSVRDGAFIQKSGHHTRPTLYFGLEPDFHVSSLQLEHKVCR